MLVIHNITLSPDQGEEHLYEKCAKRLRLPRKHIGSLQILRRSVDCRKKPDIRMVYSVGVEIEGNPKLSLSKINGVEEYRENSYLVPRVYSEERPVVVGFGPAGMFCALVLARAGLRPIVLERGECVEQRQKKVETYWSGGELDEESNVQFGEGGAGTFSDGKLNTGIRDERIQFVLKTFHQLGANESVCYDAKPHVGTDVLYKVVKNMRREILSLGGEIFFSSRFCDFSSPNGVLEAAFYEKDGQRHELSCRHLVLALGHSAADTFHLLHQKGVEMTAMPFAVGVRIEHPQKLIDLAQYGEEAMRRYGLPPAEYKISYRSSEGEKVHSFCMCPGGVVVAASSHKDGVVTNGMSNSKRDGENANSALLIPLNRALYEGEDPLAGLRYQRELEKKAFCMGGSDHSAPMQLVGDFLLGKPSTQIRSVTPTYRPGVRPSDFRELFGQEFCDILAGALRWMDTKIPGFAHPDAVMTAPESRSSSPVRIVRNEKRHSSVSGLIPCGEGAGYAGGIVSAAVDGILCAESVLAAYLK